MVTLQLIVLNDSRDTPSIFPIVDNVHYFVIFRTEHGNGDIRDTFNIDKGRSWLSVNFLIFSLVVIVVVLHLLSINQLSIVCCLPDGCSVGKVA